VLYECRTAACLGAKPRVGAIHHRPPLFGLDPVGFAGLLHDTVCLRHWRKSPLGNALSQMHEMQHEMGIEHQPYSVASPHLKGMTMIFKKIGLYMFAAAIAGTVFTTTGCEVHAGYYDPYYHDHHPVDGEVVFYGQWEQETHRDHKDFKQRNKDEKKEYWDWRHKHDDKH
jgi:hypothetical protein